MTIYILQFNQYYNRQVRFSQNIREYESDTWVSKIEYHSDINFVPGDGVDTKQVLNYVDMNPDYLIVTDDATDDIISRWYVMESNRLRNGQCELTLHRDLVADFYEEVIHSKCFIEKASLPINNNLIFNKENMTFNEIKTSQKPLMDKTECPWIVGYIAKDTPTKDITSTETTIEPNYDLSDFSKYKFDKYSRDAFNGAPSKRTIGLRTHVDTANANYLFMWDENGNKANYLGSSVRPQQTGWGIETGAASGYTYNGGQVDSVLNKVIANAKKENWKSFNYKPYTGEHSAAETDELLREEGKIIKTGGQYYTVHIYKVQQSTFTRNVNPSEGLGAMIARTKNGISIIQNNYVGYTGFVQIESPFYRVQYVPYTGSTLTLEISANRTHLTDGPYDMFAIPYGDIRVMNGIDNFNVSKEASMRIAQQITVDLGSGAAANLYDLQLLPYCPLPVGTIATRKTLDLTFYGQNKETNFAYVMSGGAKKSVLVWCRESQFVSQLEFNKVALPTDPIEFKVADHCDKYRIVSPNYASAFDIKATANGGLGYFTATCSYKPYNPYIRVAPEFGRLYGQRFQDARGLILGGDFSLPRTDSAWTRYEMNNKNYQLSFDRQIDNLEFNQRMDRNEAIANIVAGAATATASGAAAGGLWGGPVGAGVGAGVGAITSVGAGIADYAILDQRQKEVLDFTKDQYNMSIQNIMAQPHTLSRVSAFNKDNHYFPIVEYYTCSETEKQALRDKIKYNGMTVGVIGTISEYLQDEPTYIKAKLIRTNISDDYHLVLALADELNKGVFI